MGKGKPLTQQAVNELLRYEEDTGLLFWRERDASWFVGDVQQSAESRCAWWNGRFAGEEALAGINGRGYRGGRIFGKTYTAHRIIWFMKHGCWPEMIDHKNGNPLDNRLENLRACSRRENSYNERLRGGTSRFKGVSWRSSNKKWCAQIKDKGKKKHLGYFDCEEQAAVAYDTAALELHGEFKRLNFPNKALRALAEGEEQ